MFGFFAGWVAWGALSCEVDWLSAGGWEHASWDINFAQSSHTVLDSSQAQKVVNPFLPGWKPQELRRRNRSGGLSHRGPRLSLSEISIQDPENMSLYWLFTGGWIRRHSQSPTIQTSASQCCLCCDRSEKSHQSDERAGIQGCWRSLEHLHWDRVGRRPCLYRHRNWLLKSQERTSRTQSCRVSKRAWHFRQSWVSDHLLKNQCSSLTICLCTRHSWCLPLRLRQEFDRVKRARG